MNSTDASESLLTVSNLKLYFELEHYHQKDIRDVFVNALSHPVDFFFKTKELFYAIDDVSFELKRGDRLGILGVNGSGKTSLCRCIADMMTAQSGKIVTNGSVRAIFDVGTGIMPELTGRENAVLLARLFFPKIKNVLPLVNEAIEFSELGHFIDVPFKQYSKGMQSRLLLSIISSTPTDLLILDEVFEGADVFFQKKISQRMKNLISNTAATIFVSHSIEQVKELCNKLMVLNKGKIQYFGSVEEGIKVYLNR